MPLLKNISSFDDRPLPERILYDTSFIINLLTNIKQSGSSKDFRMDCEGFAQALYKNHSEVYITEWVLCEVCNYCYINLIKEKLSRDYNLEIKNVPREDIFKEYKDNPGVLIPFHGIVKNIVTNLYNISQYRKLEESSFAIRERALSLVRRYNIFPNDAYIIATAIVNKIENIATVDIRDFNRVISEVNVFGPQELIKIYKLHKL